MVVTKHPFVKIDSYLNFLLMYKKLAQVPFTDNFNPLKVHV